MSLLSNRGDFRKYIELESQRMDHQPAVPAFDNYLGSNADVGPARSVSDELSRAHVGIVAAASSPGTRPITFAASARFVSGAPEHLSFCLQAGRSISFA